MARNLLTASQIKNATSNPDGKPKRHNDGGGLYLIAFKSGLRSWRYNYSFAGKQQTIGYGSYPDLSLSEAREFHRESLKLKGRGINPAEQKQKEKYKLGTDSFQAVATGRCRRDVTLDLRGALKPIITRHRSAITDPNEIGELLRALADYQGGGCDNTLCLEDIALCVCANGRI